MRVWKMGLLGLLLSLGAARAQGPVPLGEEFQVNTYTTDSQRWPDVAVGPASNFVIVWQSYGSSGTDTSGASIQGRLFDAAGNAVGGEFQVNTSTAMNQWLPSVAAGADGDFVVVWQSSVSSGTDTSGASIQGQRYDAGGNPVGGEFQVNTYTTDVQWEPSVAAGADGDFAVVWMSYGSSGTDTHYFSIQGQRFDSAGNAVGGEFQVNTYTTSDQGAPSVAAGADGDFVVVWMSYGSSGTDTHHFSIQGQRFDSAGNAVGGEFQVNTYTTRDQGAPSVAAGADGDFVVVWQSRGSYGTDTSGASVQGQRYDASGTPVGAEFQVNTYTTSNQGYRRPSLAVAADGHFVVVWSSRGSLGTDSSSYSLQGQWFDADTTPLGGQFQVNTYTTNYQGYGGEVAMARTGDSVVVWDSDGSYGTDDSWKSIQAQRYSTAAIFTDGFESGDTSAWSSSVP